jgi:hypothetical protein
LKNVDETSPEGDRLFRRMGCEFSRTQAQLV